MLSFILIVLLLCILQAFPSSRISFSFSQALTFCSPSLSETCDGFSFLEEFFNALVVSPVPGSYLFLISRCLKPLTLGSWACNEMRLLLCRGGGREGEVENSFQCLPWKGSSQNESLREVFMMMDEDQWGWQERVEGNRELFSNYSFLPR